MKNMDVIKIFKKKFNLVKPFLNEKTLRIWAATESKIFGYGGVTLLHKVTGLARTTIALGLEDLKSKKKLPIEQLRRSGGGRKKITETDPMLLGDLESLLEPVTRGDPESILRWTCKSTAQLANALNKKEYRISSRKICDLLSDLGYSLQANNKTNEGASHPDRDQQFLFIYKKAKSFLKAKQPVISVDTKKKEMIGNYKNNGKEWSKKRNPKNVNAHDFPDPKVSKAAPYGIYDIARNEGWVSVGISCDTAEFAVASIKKWWLKMGKKRYPNAKKILISADCGGSNGRRSRLWKAELQKLANKLQLDIHVSHFPPGTSKWNKIEHKMFSFISINWRGRPLTTYNVVVNLIANTKTKSGLEIMAEMDLNEYKKGIKITDEEFNNIKLKPCKFHGEWNYSIKFQK
jgi:hypothetical protein